MVLSEVTKDDNFSQIIRLIYETDDYIYPLLCGHDYDYFEKIMRHHLDTDSIFSYKNIVAAKKDGEIVGIILTFTKDQSLPPLPENGEFDIRECYRATMNDYFRKLLSGVSSDCLYINNLCVDSKHQGYGIGRALIQYAIENSVKDKIVLDCLADNLSAVALYKKCGFEVVDSFPGFSGDDTKPVECLKLEVSRRSNEKS